MLGSQTLADRYELRRQIGVGGMARVYLAWDGVLHRNVAIKILNEAVSADPSFVARFKREAQAAAGLDCPHIVHVYDCGRVSDGAWPVYYLVMEYVAGPNLKEMIRERGALPEREALQIAADVAAALQAAHEHGIIHRDIKPQNILIGASSRVKVADFGIARATGLTQLTTTQTAVYGSAHYVSPEQAQSGTADERSDIYSLGAVLYEMLTGHEPFAGDSLLEVVLQHVHGQVVPPAQAHPGVSPAADATVTRALAKSPTDRFSSASDMRKALLQAAVEPERSMSERDRAGAQAAPIPINRPQPVSRRPALATSPARRGSNRRPGRRIPSWLVAIPAVVLVLGTAFAVLHALTGPAGHPSHAATPPRTVSPAVPKSGKPSSRGHQAGGNRSSTSGHRSSGTTGAARSATARTGKGHTSSSSPPAVAAPPVGAASGAVSAATSTPAPAVVPAGASGASVGQAAQGAPAASSPQGSSAAPSPQGAVFAFYQDVSSRDFGSAAQLWTTSLQSRDPPLTYINDRFAATSSIDIERMSARSMGYGRATVDVTLVEHLQGGTSRTWVGSWDLIRSGNFWLLDNPRF